MKAARRLLLMLAVLLCWAAEFGDEYIVWTECEMCEPMESERMFGPRGEVGLWQLKSSGKTLPPVIFRVYGMNADWTVPPTKFVFGPGAPDTMLLCLGDADTDCMPLSDVRKMYQGIRPR